MGACKPRTSYLGQTSVYEEFGSGNEAGILGGEKHRQLWRFLQAGIRPSGTIEMSVCTIPRFWSVS